MAPQRSRASGMAQNHSRVRQALAQQVAAQARLPGPFTGMPGEDSEPAEPRMRHFPLQLASVQAAAVANNEPMEASSPVRPVLMLAAAGVRPGDDAGAYDEELLQIRAADMPIPPQPHQVLAGAKLFEWDGRGMKPMLAMPMYADGRPAVPVPRPRMDSLALLDAQLARVAKRERKVAAQQREIDRQVQQDKRAMTLTNNWTDQHHGASCLAGLKPLPKLVKVPDRQLLRHKRRLRHREADTLGEALCRAGDATITTGGPTSMSAPAARAMWAEEKEVRLHALREPLPWSRARKRSVAGRRGVDSDRTAAHPLRRPAHGGNAVLGKARREWQASERKAAAATAALVIASEAAMRRTRQGKAVQKRRIADGMVF